MQPCETVATHSLCRHALPPRLKGGFKVFLVHRGLPPGRAGGVLLLPLRLGAVPVGSAAAPCGRRRANAIVAGPLGVVSQDGKSLLDLMKALGGGAASIRVAAGKDGERGRGVTSAAVAAAVGEKCCGSNTRVGVVLQCLLAVCRLDFLRGGRWRDSQDRIQVHHPAQGR